MTSRWLIGVSVLAVVAACATNPVTGRRQVSLMSEAQEAATGRDADGQVRQEMGIYDDPALVAYVQDIGRRLAARSHRPTLEWHFSIVDEAAVNAFALPGGYIYLTRGILAYLNDEAELAGVLGHEIGHVTARHAAQQYTRAMGGTLGLLGLGIFVPAARPFGQIGEQALGVLFLKYGRDDELQADDLGAEYAAKTGYDPGAVPEFLATLGRIEEASDSRGMPNWLSTHPQAADRVTKIQQTVAALQAGGAGTTRSRDTYLQQVDRVVVGDNPRHGIVRGSEFLHPDLRFRLRFPDGWDITNGRQQVVAKQPGAERYMLLQSAPKTAGRTLDAVAVRTMSAAGFEAVDGGDTTIGGRAAYVGTWRGQAQSAGDTVARAAFIALGPEIYMLVGLAPAPVFGRAEPAFAATIASFREMSAAEAGEIRPNRLALYTARPGDTWQGIAERASRGVVKPTTLAIMNGHPTDEPPRSGERLKIVVGG